MHVLMDFQDRAIRLTDERRRHIAECTEPTADLAAIRDTLARPEVMTEAFHHPELRLFYRIYSRRSPDERMFHVVVKVRGYDMLVVTAFFGKEMSWGERDGWVKDLV
jgi:hypothetical protein